MSELKKRFTTEILLDKISAEKGWELTAKALLNFLFLRGSISVVPLLGKGEGIIAPVWGWEKYKEIANKVMGDLYTKMILWKKEEFNIEVENCIGALKLTGPLFSKLHSGPEWIGEIIEATPEKAVVRYKKCAWWERYKEFKIKPELSLCEPVHQLIGEEILPKINPKITRKLVKSMPRGDPYCEDVYEFKEE